ncbi:site-specific DNA-methyltransferase [Helicobacter macacae]|uniref:DNA methylase N-4/N-6 domain-containing protein n=1 Tax=Helicobacter macacae MIT 99-5501 TaxID=1357400 RepID=V8C629_9HELI|nr:site-specific DNA-methyltransferase [Helicobacter macacae]ETD22211.1 hypothetical protein HMPREF2086_01938 [Helicobacter macacae MIT 99-5501]
MDYKKAFYSKLEDCYLGAKVKEASANKEIKWAKESNTNSAFANSQASSNDSSTKSGFTNLLHIKEQYFTHIKAHLESRIKSLIGNDTIESNDIYNKLYTFFDSYLNETGTPFFTDTPIYKNIYAKIYSNSKDTSLFYKTQNLYYVKSDTLYQSLILQDNAEKDSKSRFSIFFDASEYKQNADNSKNKVLFKLDCITNGALNSAQNPTHPLAPSAEGGGTIELHSASEGEQEDNLSIPQITIKVTNQKDLFPDSFNVFKSNSNEFSDDFIKALSDNDLLPKKPTDSHIESLKKLFSSYKKQNEIDFFIHKNAKEFLQEQFDLWMFSYLYKDSAFQQWEAVSIKRLQNVKNLAYEIIDFIAAFEEELKAIWLKPKFAKNTQYVFSIDTILSNATNANALLANIFSDSHFESQVKEWKELNLVDEDFAISSLQETVANSPSFAEGDRGWVSQYKFLPIDTKYLSKESRFALLSAFSDLESLLNGELIKSDNFQVLNSIMPKYQGKIDLIYIDPPFNLGENASFDYKVNFKDSTWASLLDSRLELANQILSNKGSIFVRCDYNGNFIVRSLLNNIFGEDNFINEIVVSKSAKLTETIKKYHSGSDSLFFFGKTNDYIFNVQGIQREERKWRDMHLPGERWSPIPNDYIHLFSQGNLVVKNGKYTSKARIILGKELLPPNGRHWALSQETIFELEKRSEIRLIDGNPKTQESDIKKLTSNWTDWVGYSSDWGFQTENHEKVLQRAILTGSNKNSTILDFFAGSGTTCAVALKLGRKFVGVEMGEHFYKVVLPRLKKVIAGFASGISKEVDYKGGGVFRYYELESYEEALANCEYVLNPPSLSTSGDKWGGCSIIDYRKSRKLIKELNKECDKPITLNMGGYRAEFDIFQTIANLMGWKIKRLFLDKTHPLTPSAREGESIEVESCEYSNGEILNVQSINIAKYPKLKTLIFWDKE